MKKKKSNKIFIKKFIFHNTFKSLKENKFSLQKKRLKKNINKILQTDFKGIGFHKVLFIVNRILEINIKELIIMNSKIL